MRPRTFILLILVLLLLVVAAGAVFLVTSGLDPITNLLGIGDNPPSETEGQEDGDGDSGPSPTPTPEVRFVPVVAAVVDMKVGERITEELVRIENRPDDNVAVVAGVTFNDIELVIGQILKTNVSAGQEIIRPMLALNPTDIVTLGSDLALYIDQGRITVAVPIDRYSGAAFAMRPGDFVDILMSLKIVQLDPEFQTARPNVWIRVFEPGLLQGTEFLFGQTSEGRLEFIPELGTPGVVGPQLDDKQIPRRITQLTIQQAEVIWVGSWNDPVNGLQQSFPADAVLTVDETQVEDPEAPVPQPTPVLVQGNPDIAILSLTVQDALALKFAFETGVEIHLALRSQGDNSVFITTSVSLPQLVEQGVLTIPEPSEFGLEPRLDLVPTPGVPDFPDIPSSQIQPPAQ